MQRLGVLRFVGDSHPPYRILGDDRRIREGIDADMAGDDVVGRSPDAIRPWLGDVGIGHDHLGGSSRTNIIVLAGCQDGLSLLEQQMAGVLVVHIHICLPAGLNDQLVHGHHILPGNPFALVFVLQLLAQSLQHAVGERRRARPADVDASVISMV